MSHLTTRRGGRAWFGKTEAKTDGNVTRRQDDRSTVADGRDELEFGDLVSEMRALPDGSLTQREVNELLDTIADLERQVAALEDHASAFMNERDALRRELGY